MKKKTDIETLCDKLLNQIHSSPDLKATSLHLESLVLDRQFKTHASNIVTDSELNTTQKKRQLLYLLGTIDLPLLHDFFSDEIDAGDLWLFDNQKIDYLDEFVKKFQQSTESVHTLHLTTAAPLTPHQIRNISKDLGHEFGYHLVVDHTINPTLIGGIQVKLDNYIFDYSLRSKFQQFQREWLASLEKTTKLVGRYETEV
jgi:F0F1-type ATP synthase delta subunit